MRESENFYETCRQHTEVRVKRLITTENSHPRTAERLTRLGPLTGMIGFVRGVIDERNDEAGIARGADRLAQEQGPFQFALAIPIKLPRQIPSKAHDVSPDQISPNSGRSTFRPSD